MSDPLMDWFRDEPATRVFRPRIDANLSCEFQQEFHVCVCVCARARAYIYINTMPHVYVCRALSFIKRMAACARI